MREAIAGQILKYYNLKESYESISDCDGCRSASGRLFAGCHSCEIRICAQSRRVESCAFCADYACEILKKHFSLDPDARTRLENIRVYFLA